MQSRYSWLPGLVLAAAALVRASVAPAADVDYGGRVLNELRQPIAGAKVAVVGTPLSATTDSSGAFTLKGAARAARETVSSLNPLEFSAEGYFARTLVPDSAEMQDIVVVLDSTASAVEGKAVDVGRFAYGYRKGAPDNPVESKWLPPYPAAGFDNTLLCGFLWEGLRHFRCVEVELPNTDGAAPDVKDLHVVANKSHWWKATNWEHFVCTEKPVTTSRGTRTFAFHTGGGHPIKAAKLSVIYSDGNPSAVVPIVRVVGNARWSTPQAVEIEWGFDKAGKSFNGSIEAYNGFVGTIEPLESGNGIVATGEHHWRQSAASGGRRGIRVTVFQTSDGMSNVTVRTSGGTVTFAPSDLESGPILVPSVGVFITSAGSGVTARQFQETLAAEKKQTLRQRVREHVEQSWAGAMGTFFELDKLPAFPVPPEEPPMQIDVPEKELVAQWKLGAWHLMRHTRKLNDRMYGVSIFASPFYLAQESWLIIKAMDMLGLHDVAEGGLNYWIFAEQHGSNPNFSDNDGYLPRDDRADMRHTVGHGNILETAAFHYRLTRNKAWLDEAAPVLKNACRWTIRQRQFWNSQVPTGSWFYGLVPPLSTGDLSTESQVFYITCLTYYAGLKAAVEVLAENGVDGAAEMLTEVERWRRDLRAVGDRSAALSRVVQVSDGTYRRFIPFLPYLRAPAWDFRHGISTRTTGGDYFEVTGGGLRFIKEGIYDVHEPLAQEMLDVMEERLSALNDFGDTNPMPRSAGPTRAEVASDDRWFNTGGNGGHAPGQCGYEPHTNIYFAADDVPLFLRAMYNQYAVDMLPADGYVFAEHPFRGGAPDKPFEEAAFLERVRMMLLTEEGDSLWLARATPRAWLEQGKRVAVRNAPSFFGTVAYEIVSDVQHGRITATVEMPSRNRPKAVLLRLRHPKGLPITSVTVNGKDWIDFNRDEEAVALHDVTGSVSVEVKY